MDPGPRVGHATVPLLHALPLSLASNMASCLDARGFAHLALASRHDYATVSHTPFAGAVYLTITDAMHAIYPPNVRRCRLLEVETLPLDPRITARWVVVGISTIDRYTGPLNPGMLPGSLVGLWLGDDFNLPLVPGSLPESLRVLHLGWEFNQRLVPGALPKSLRMIHLSRTFNQPLVPGRFLMVCRSWCLATTSIKRWSRGPCPSRFASSRLDGASIGHWFAERFLAVCRS